jgi:phospholipid/cholesterol/gamma-HCH transport system permease protein
MSEPPSSAAPDRVPGASPGRRSETRRAIGHGIAEAAKPLMRFFETTGGHLILLARALAWLPRRPARIGNYLDAGEYIGFGSLPIVVLVGAFTGMVTALQAVYAFRVFGMESFSGGTTGFALSVELGPVLTCLMLAGRAGAGIATEIGTMRISEQIDALESMAVNPIQFLVLPRIVAGALMAPILTLIFFIVGMGGAYLVAVINMGVDGGQFVFYVKEFVQPVHVLQGLIKAGVFGLVVTLIGCYQGYNASGGGRGVGIGTTRAVVIGSVAVLVLDYFLTEILFVLLPEQR